MALKRNISYHISEDRLDRATFIATTIGFGAIIKERYCVDEQGRPAWKCLTDTGVMLIFNGKRDKVVTLYIATVAQVSWIYEGNTPYSVYRTVVKNKALVAQQNLPADEQKTKKGRK